MNVDSSTSAIVSQAVASYAAQLQAVRPREPFPEDGPREPAPDRTADRVTLAAAVEADQAAYTPTPTPARAAEIPPPLLDEDNQVAMTSKSVTRALEAYVQASVL